MQIPVAAVSLGAVRHNARVLSERARLPLIAVIKDDAYGHGAEAVAHALCGEAWMFAVSTVEEGARLAAAGVGKDILVLTPPLSRSDALRAAHYDLIVTAASYPSLALCAGMRAHLAVNTGMNRYGVSPQEALGAARRAAECRVAVEGVFSHLYDPADAAARRAQERVFAECARAVRSVFPDAVRHLAATGGIFAGGALFDAVRPGLGLYGYAPQPFSCGELCPAMRVDAFVSQNTLPFGGGAGYGAAGRRYASLHTLCAGYGHGFFREGGLGAVGTLCMDACVREGDVPFGARVCILKDAAAYAAQHGTTAYEVLTCIGRGTRKHYVG